MCLERIDSRHRPTKKVVKGYKRFWLDADNKMNFCYWYASSSRSQRVPLGRWLKAKKRQIERPEYQTGFHFWPNSGYVSVQGFRTKVLARGVRIKGEQGMEAVWVADEIFVPKPGQEIVERDGKLVVVNSRGKVVS